MKGIVFKINPNGGMIALKVDENDFTIIEASTDYFEIGDEVSWDEDEGLGCGSVFNVNQEMDVDVTFENHNVQTSQLRTQLRF